MNNVEILEWMIKDYEKRGGGYSQKEALKEAITCMKSTPTGQGLGVEDIAKIIEKKVWESHEDCKIKPDDYKECPERCCYINCAKELHSHFSKPDISEEGK